MRKNEKRVLLMGSMLVVAFAVWTALIQIVDVQPVGQNGTSIGFSTFNCWFHNLTGVHMSIYDYRLDGSCTHIYMSDFCRSWFGTINKEKESFQSGS